ncbi:hypothetical protein Acel_1424 [Acidothermus cellulolyticus 11B]|jgi:hypothetical protein|uniref:Uncharacterized protein n=1 Tax=Acidothermus cellulolyticus (strain ATCC 43068 / DSM 8971 / 11B) TaxID=351607 RepID=A0LUT6_ACIC1|nr:DUF6295 family protein [Acidothermus cellulolyticus]ABK53196.1 hypothetical protein Acel_1424 [Acidothermus cellulolyticus 11B]MBX5447513.1 hypothetical protein [Acidothermus cellulolyticus]MCL6550472.1 DUF6295 family protein [Acidothermus cellulolyticus]
MCTYVTKCLPIHGSAKGPHGWFSARTASVYLDHPVHAPADHTLNIDVLNPERGPEYRVAVELDPASARELAYAILELVETFGDGGGNIGTGPTRAG